MRRLLLISLPALACAAAAFGADFEGLAVREIQFSPEYPALSAGRLEEAVRLEVGEPFEAEQARESLHRLFSTGRFANLELHVDPLEDGVRVTFRSEPNHFIGDVRIEGAEEPPTLNQLINATQLRLGQLFTQQAVARAQQSLRQMLLDGGFPHPAVDYRLIDDPDTQQVDIVFELSALDRSLIGDLILTGDSGLEPSRLRDIAKWDDDKPYTSPRIADGLERVEERLHKDGYWQAQARLVGRDFDSDNNEIDLVVDVQRGPLVTVQVVGADLSAKKIRRMVPIFEEGVVDEDLLFEGEQNLRDYLQTEGYFDVRVSREQETTADRIAIIYRVELGPRRKLRRVVVSGNRFFDDETIRERMLIQESSFEMRRGRFSQRLLERDQQAVAALYRSNGFRDVEVRGLVGDGGSNTLVVEIAIDEGEPTLVERLQVSGMERFPLDPGDFRFSTAPGQPFSEASVATDRDLILGEYFNEGFQDASFDWTVEPVGEPEDNRVAVTYTVEEGERLYVNRPIISGLDHTKRELVERMILLEPGRPLSQNAMFESQRRLYDLGVFTKVDTALQNPDGEERTKNVLFELEEARRWMIGFGGGAEFARIGGGTVDVDSPVGDAAFAPRLTLEVTRLNVRGLGRTISFRSRVSTLQQRALFTYQNPRWTGSEKWRLTLSGLWDTSRNVRTFTGTRLEGALQLEHTLSRDSTALYRYTYRRTTIDGDSLQITPLLIPLSSQPVRAALFSGTYIQDRRDDPTDATRGVFNSVDLSFAAGYWGSQPDFFRYLGQNSTYHQITRKIVLARTVQLGLMLPWGPQEGLPMIDPGVGAAPDPRIPISERFFFGGATSHRGFPFNQGGPRDPTTGFPIGGGAQFLNSVELRFPLYGENLGGVLFHDAGNVYSRVSEISFRPQQPTAVSEEDGSTLFGYDYMVHAVGFGMRYRTPVGPVRLDFAYSVNPPRFVGFSGTRQDLLTGQGSLTEQRINQFQFHFSLGQTF